MSKICPLFLPRTIVAAILLTATGAHAEDVGSCPYLTKADTRVIIGANTPARKTLVWNVVVANGLQQKGFYCYRSDGVQVWMSHRIPKAERMPLFNHFQNAGLVRPLQLRRAF